MTLLAHFKTTYTIQLSVSQACILLLFNDRGQWTLDELYQATSISVKTLQSTLHDLSSDKHKILLVDSHNVRLNTDYVSSSTRIHIPPTWVHENEEVPAITNRPNEGGCRQQMIDASMVRVMKANRSMEKERLYDAVRNMLQKKLLDMTDEVLDERINSLILRDYLTKEPSSNAYVPEKC